MRRHNQYRRPVTHATPPNNGYYKAGIRNETDAGQIPANTNYPPAVPYNGAQTPFNNGAQAAPFNETRDLNLPVQSSTPTGGGSNPLANLPIGDIRAMVDKLGGVEGIFNTINKMNGFMKQLQQFSPMLKLLLGSFGKGAAAATAAEAALLEDRSRRRRRRRKRRKSGSSRRKSSNLKRSSSKSKNRKRRAKR
ncbi:hypothetical protein [Chengkuizengella sediminis]|uniref:hypothetical protein n=1 Tax=Chengkuizengella sediminis TaxID=1885917 RepID=UPI0013896F30|nr:hypothetical protein [Chengkuizengella sediminis]NDI35999.1 hypothetical protein [Chengkuizengella sediminis]